MNKKEYNLELNHRQRQKDLIQELGEIGMVPQDALDEMKRKIDQVMK